MKKILVLMVISIGGAMFYGCEEGPFGNTPPQGRPEWMKKDAGKP